MQYDNLVSWDRLALITYKNGINQWVDLHERVKRKSIRLQQKKQSPFT